MQNETPKEAQYHEHLEIRKQKGSAILGLMANRAYQMNPRNLVFILSRYKFVSKMLSGRNRVLEIGCGDATGTRLVLQEVGGICAVDYDPIFVNDVNMRMDEDWKFDCRVHDITTGPVEENAFDAAYSMDVIEHIPKELEDKYVENIVRSLKENGTFIVGTPSLQSQVYASEGSLIGHVNCKTQQDLKALLEKYFHNIFFFSMNDEVVHTGFYPMAQYLLALCVGQR